MKRPPRSGFALVATRELRWILRDRVALFLMLGVPLIAFTVLALTFSSAVIRDLGVAVVDADRSPTSVAFAHVMDAAPGVAVKQRVDDLAAAMRAIRSGDAVAAAYIPENFERDLAAGRRPQIPLFYNTQFMTPGNAALKALNDATQFAIAAIAPPAADTAKTGGSLRVEQYVLTNPAFNYGQFLLRAVLPMVLHVIVTVSTCYAVGSEFSRRSMRGWLRAAGGNPLVAFAGKLAPLFCIFVTLMIVLTLILHVGYGLPFQGSSVLVTAAACLLILAYQGLGALLPLLTRNLALGLSLCGLVVSPAFGFAGVGFPRVGMLGFARGWSDVLPLRWYLEVLFDQAARGAPLRSSLGAFFVLALLAILFVGLALWRLHVVARKPAARPAPPAPLKLQPTTLVGAFRGELARVMADRSVKGVLVAAPVIYGLFYPQPYIGQTLRHVPIAVVDHDRTELSRELIMTLDADSALRVAVRADTLAEAQRSIFERRTFGILLIPEGTTRDVLKGQPARLPAYVDSAYFLVFNATLGGIAEAAGTVNLSLATSDARATGIVASGLAASSPATVLPVPLFNPTGGYASYIVPAAFILILQQTLLIGSAMLGGASFERGGRDSQMARASATGLLGHALAHLVLYLPALLLYFYLLPHLYGFAAVGAPLDLLVFAACFLFATSLLGQAVGLWCKHPETAVVLVIATSLPQFFLVGLAWPGEAIPSALRAAGRLLPSESAIDGLVRINQMGASLGEVAGDWINLLALGVVYFVFAIAGARLRRWRWAHAT
ncbi:MAG: type transporter [Rhodospirillales bacterium]|nr:type transporter [Rhodospirillales bacterium]